MKKAYSAAEQYLGKALLIDPDSTDALNNLGTLYALNHQYDSAVRLFRKVLDLNPGNQYAQLNLGRITMIEKNKKIEREKSVF